MLEVAQKYLQLKSGEYYKCFGKVDKVVGLTIESIGPKAKLNDLCMIFLDKERRDYVMSEVVGFKDSHIILMPFDNVEVWSTISRNQILSLWTNSYQSCLVLVRFRRCFRIF